MSTNFNDEWWQWRRSKDAHDRDQDAALHRLDTDMAVLKTRQDISISNADARHSRTTPTVIGVITAAVSLIVLVMQILAWRGSMP